MARNLTLADGQLGTTAAAILDGAVTPASGRVNIVFADTSVPEATVTLTFQFELQLHNQLPDKNPA